MRYFPPRGLGLLDVGTAGTLWAGVGFSRSGMLGRSLAWNTSPLMCLGRGAELREQVASFGGVRDEAVPFAVGVLLAHEPRLRVP